jgi:CHASE2 domain-containing sensor protein
VIKMSNPTGLSDEQQAIAVFLTALVAALAGWATAGFPTSRIAIGAVLAAILIGAGLAIKEWFGTSTPAAPAATATIPKPAAKAVAIPIAVSKLKHRLMFLELRK